MPRPLAKRALVAFAMATLFSACAGLGPAKEEARPHDARTDYVNAPANAVFNALPDAITRTDRWSGLLGSAPYRVEVPENWNGRLVLYAHGYAGDGKILTVQDPPIRRFLIDSGYAWAASAYSKNHYDVRAGVEDTNALALAFNEIAERNGRRLARPTKTFIYGRSMGGHVAAAAIEQETLATARNKFVYDGALPTCAVLDD
ncbi:MAG: alpha/beta hydrolase, partial [Burkholderiaceae bacterium]